MKKKKNGKHKKEFVPIIRLAVIREGKLPYGHKKITTAKRAAELGRKFIGDADRECFAVCCLDGSLKPLSIEKVAIGSVDKCETNMREIFKYAVLSNAAYLLVFHNHPSGEEEPSKEDILVTEKLRRAGELMGIPVADHIIIGADSYVSLATKLGWLEK